MVVPSTMGRMSRCTPSRLTSGPWPLSRPAILSISSRKMMPLCSTRSSAVLVTWSMSIRRCSSSAIKYSKASLTFIFRFLVRWPKMLGSMSLKLTSMSSMPWLLMISNEGMFFSRTSSSTVRSSSLPSRSCWRSLSRLRVALASAGAAGASPSRVMGSPGAAGAAVEIGVTLVCAVAVSLAGVGGSRRSRMRSSAFISAFSATSSSFSSRTMSMAISMRSRIMDSTSRPT